MLQRLKELRQEAAQYILEAADMQELEQLRVKMLGKKGELTALLRSMGSLPPEERPSAGQMVNEVRALFEALLEEKLQELAVDERAASMAKEKVDITMPGKARAVGNLHPLTLTSRRIRDIFVGLGFQVHFGPEIEYAKYNFDLLNIPADHPAREEQDTFYITDDIVLRTHTSPMQARIMLQQKPPIRMIVPGRVYRADDVDATHSPIFNQIEGLVVDEGICMGDLRNTLDVFAKQFYGKQTRTRFRVGYFPFTEPSAEVDASCAACGGSGCRVCKGTGWVEVLGCGMVHPNVLENCGIDSHKYSGFAFGLGLDRLTNIKYGIDDIRMLYENNARFLEQFKGAW